MEKFLRERGIGEEVIKKLQEEKIDKETVNHMRDDELANYLPRHGDRLALVRFCKKKSADGEKRKNSLMKKLQQKLNEKKRMDFSAASDSDEEAIPGRRVTRMSKQLRGNVNAKKNSRRIDIGWIHKEGEEVRQIRTKKGGGTRKLIVDKDTTNHELLDKAKELFFPKGRCAFGLAIDYDFELWDFAQNRINGTITVAEMYDNLKLGTIRVYLKSSVKSSKDESESIIEEAARIAGIRDNCTEKTEEKHDDLPDLEPQIIVCDDSSGDVIPSSDLAKLSNPDNFADDDNEANDFSLEHYIGELTNTESTYTHDDSEVTFPHLDLNNDPLFETDGQGQTQKLKVEVNEGRILLDMLTAFKDPSILNANIEIRRKIHGGESEEMESGSGSGMMRDVLTEFWSEFYQQCTVGCGYKVPFTRHDYQKEEWLAVSRIIYKGWKVTWLYKPIKFVTHLRSRKLTSELSRVYYEMLTMTSIIKLNLI